MGSQTIWRSFGIGLTAGLRSMTAPAVVRWRVRDPIRLALAALAVGELVADKLPATPARTSPPALVFRVLSGGFSGSTLARTREGDGASGAVAGAIGAVCGAYGGMALRAAVGRWSGLPDPLVALAEDAVAIGAAVAVSRP